MSEERLNATRPEEEQLNGVVVSAIQSLKKKKKKEKSFPFKHRSTNIDSQNHKHKLRFERGHEPKKKKIEPKKNIGELGPPRLYL